MKRAAAYLIISLAALSCAEVAEGPTIKVPEEQAEGSRLDAPGVRIIDVKVDGFTANWMMVPDAKEYEYTFDDQEPMITTDTTLIFTGLAEDTEHVLRLHANPRVESGRLPSPEVSVNVVTSVVGNLDSPKLAVGSSYSSISVISWGVVPLAEEYEWELSNGQKGSTIKTFVTFSGLIEGREYDLRVRAMIQENDTWNPSDWSEVRFTPTNDGSAELLFSNFAATSDAITFNVFANASQYYWYEIIPKSAYKKFASEEAYYESVKSGIEAKVKALTDKGTDRKDAYASVLYSGSRSVIFGACECLSYSIAYFGMDLEGKADETISRKEITTPYSLESNGPEYKSAGDWFNQTAWLGSSTNQPPTTYIFFKRIGTNVADIKYKRYTTSTFIKTFGEKMDDNTISEIKETLKESGSTADVETVIPKVNSASGYNAGYSGLTPGTAYTLAALATSTSGKEILCINSLKTRSTAEDNNWVSYSLRTRDASSFVLRVVLKEGLDAVAGGFYYAPSTSVTSTYSRAEYSALVQNQGTAFTAAQVSDLNSNGYVDISVSGLTTETTYFVGTWVTNSVDDTIVKTSNVSTK